MKVSWMTIRTVSKDNHNLGALPGMISVLHTFGSACNYHIHVHSLVTFGGVNNDENWQYPKQQTNSILQANVQNFQRSLLG